MKKHYYPDVGRFDSGEEKTRAEYLDTLDQIEFWVRNIDSQPSRSFWFQTSKGRFYPDFVCKLKDGRYFVVEYKGKDRYDHPNEKEKREIGEIWENEVISNVSLSCPRDRSGMPSLSSYDKPTMFSKLVRQIEMWEATYPHYAWGFENGMGSAHKEALSLFKQPVIMHKLLYRT